MQKKKLITGNMEWNAIVAISFRWLWTWRNERIFQDNDRDWSEKKFVLLQYISEVSFVLQSPAAIVSGDVQPRLTWVGWEPSAQARLHLTQMVALGEILAWQGGWFLGGRFFFQAGS